MSFFDKKDIEPMNKEKSGSFFDSADIESEEISDAETISKLESGVRGAAQGTTLGYSDEIQAAIEAMAKDVGGVLGLTEPTEETPVTFDEDGRPIIPEDSGKFYNERVSEIRDQYKAAQEANPATYMASEIVGGIAPGLLTGGGAAAANIAKTGASEGAKVALKEAAKQGATLGAKYGAVSGVGYSEGEDLGEIAQDVAIGAGIGALGGAVLPVGVAGAKRAGQEIIESPVGKKVGSALTDLKGFPILKEGLESFKYSNRGESVLGDRNYKKILNDSKDIVEQELKPFLELNSSKYGKTIGSLVKKIKKVSDSKDVSNSLYKIEKQALNMLEKNKAPTEEGKVVLNELLKVLDGLKSNTKTTVSSTKNVKSGVDNALKNIQDKISKAKAIAKETGETLNFTEPKVDLETGIVSSFDSTTGKVISTPIKSGEFTPIKYNTQTSFKDMDASELKDLSTTAYQVLDKANKTSAGIANKPAGKLYGTAKDTLSDMAEESGVGNSWRDINKKFSTIKSIDESLPAKLLEKDSEVAEQMIINKVAQFIRKAELEGMSGDDLRGKFDIFANNLRKSNPEFADKFLTKANDVANRYELAKTSRQGFGFNIMGNLKASSTIAGGVLGSAKNTLVNPVNKIANNVNQLTSQQLGTFASKLSASNSSGAKMLGNRLTEAMSKEGPAQAQAIWALSQSPAFRDMVKRYSNEGDEDLKQLSGDLIDQFDNNKVDNGLEVDNLVIDPSVETSREVSREPSREPSSIDTVDEIIEPITEPTVVDSIRPSVLEGYKASEGNATFHKKLVKYQGLKGPANTRVEGSSDYGLYYDSKGKLTSGYGDLISSEKEAKEKFNLTEDRATQYLKENIKSHNKGADKVMAIMGINKKDLSTEQIDAINEMVFQLGVPTASKFDETLGMVADGDFQGAADHVKKSKWYKQTPERVNKFINRIIKTKEPSSETPVESEINLGELLESHAEQPVGDLEMSQILDENPDDMPQEVSNAEIESVIDRVNQQQSSGQDTPMSQLDQLLENISRLRISEEAKDELEVDATNMVGYNDGSILKDKIKRLQGLI